MQMFSLILCNRFRRSICKWILSELSVIWQGYIVFELENLHLTLSPFVWSLTKSSHQKLPEFLTAAQQQSLCRQDQVVIHQKCFCLTVFASLNHNQRLAQRSHIHTLYECHSTPSSTLLGRRHHGKFLWVNAIAIRHNGSQVSHNTSRQSNGKAAKVLINIQLLFMFLFGRALVVIFAEVLVQG